MNMPELQCEHLVLMKVGFHGQESLQAIIERKQYEQEQLGYCLWGYGGTLCHPIKAIRPYADQVQKMGKHLDVALSVTTSPFRSENLNPAVEYSLDGNEWSELPQDARVYASTFALVLSSLQAYSAVVDLSRYRVAAGPSTGRVASEYLRYRVDKAVLTRDDTGSEARMLSIDFTAQLVEPFATLVRRR